MSNQVGQRVMHDLRAAVFRHLQRLSLAFFTRTRTGEVQSRISNDIGGVQNVVTNTATNITSSLTTVAATMVGMLLLSWKLALFAFALIPIFAVLTRRVGNERRRIAKTTQESLADLSSQVQESLSVSGIMLGKTMGRTQRARRPLRVGVAEPRRPRSAAAHGRPLGDGVDPDELLGHAGGRVLARRHRFSHAVSIATIVAFTTLQTRLFFPVGSLLGVSLDIQTSLALFDRIFEYLDYPVDIAGEGRRGRRRAGRRRRLRRRVVQLRRERLGARGRLVHRSRRDDDRDRRRDRLGEDDARLPRRAAIRRRRRGA